MDTDVRESINTQFNWSLTHWENSVHLEPLLEPLITEMYSFLFSLKDWVIRNHVCFFFPRCIHIQLLWGNMFPYLLQKKSKELLVTFFIKQWLWMLGALICSYWWFCLWYISALKQLLGALITITDLWSFTTRMIVSLSVHTVLLLERDKHMLLHP